jgi:hypothetical protein
VSPGHWSPDAEMRNRDREVRENRDLWGLCGARELRILPGSLMITKTFVVMKGFRRDNTKKASRSCSGLA